MMKDYNNLNSLMHNFIKYHCMKNKKRLILYLKKCANQFSVKIKNKCSIKKLTIIQIKIALLNINIIILLIVIVDYYFM